MKSQEDFCSVCEPYSSLPSSPLQILSLAGLQEVASETPFSYSKRLQSRLFVSLGQLK